MRIHTNTTNNTNTTRRIFFVFITFALIFQFSIFNFQSVSAAQQTLTNGDPIVNPNESGFKLVVCDGPTLPDVAPAMLLTQENKARSAKGLPQYVPCDFNGVMRTVQHLINVMMVVGVFVAVCLISYAGALLISGNPKNKEHAKAIFPKIGIGFIIMLSAWFIVYQILDWLTTNPGFKTLLGTP